MLIEKHEYTDNNFYLAIIAKCFSSMIFYTYLLSPAACARLELKLFQLQNSPVAFARRWRGRRAQAGEAGAGTSEGAGASMNQPSDVTEAELFNDPLTNFPYNSGE